MASSGRDGPRGLSLGWRVFAALCALGAALLAWFWLADRLALASAAQFLGAGLIGLALAAVLAEWASRPLRRSLLVLDAAVKSYEAGDVSVRLAPSAQPETQAMIAFFNRLAETALEQRGLAYQKELLLETVIQSAPIAILLAGPNDRILLANHEARRMFQVAKPLTGMALSRLVRDARDELQRVLASSGGALFSLEHNGEMETYRLVQRAFRINTLRHRLIMIERLTPELRRQEVAMWKRLIRVINHELNNTLAPIQSLAHSARAILRKPDHAEKLASVFSSMEAAVRRLKDFIEDYAAFARLPEPRRERVSWSEFLAQLGSLCTFELENRLAEKDGWFDPAQLQQALINLLKNASEAAEGATPLLRLSSAGDRGVLIQVSDRGVGMTRDQMDRALLPFYSTKKSGTGLGLPLCREIVESHGGVLRLQPREGGGVTVSCRLPPAPSL